MGFTQGTLKNTDENSGNEFILATEDTEDTEI
jgi:hypothetical protein